MFARKQSQAASAGMATTLATHTPHIADLQPLTQMANLLRHRYYMVGTSQTGMYPVSYIADVIEFYCRILTERLEHGAVTSTSGQNWLNNQLPITNTPAIEIGPERFFTLLEAVTTYDPIGQMQEYTPLVRDSYQRFHALMG